VIRSILEGVAFSLRDSFTIFSDMGVPVNSIRLGGGGARSRLWRQIQADVYGKEVEVVEAEEGAAYGASILAGVGAGMWNTVDEACAAVVRVAARVKPANDAVATLNRHYQAYRKVYSATRSIFRS
jgi:xylulokinase